MRAFITGITGQDGFYLSKYLLEMGYEVHGTLRRSSSFNTSRIDGLISEYGKEDQLNLYYSDLLDSSSLNNLINRIEPDEIYNLAAQSHVAVSFKNPLYTTQTSTVGPLTLLEAVKNSKKEIKYYQASSSEMYGGVDSTKLTEDSEFNPKSPYAVGKVFAHEMTKVYRDSYGLFCVNGILFNHESPERGETFVTRKITRAVAKIALGLQDKIYLGNLNSKRDWGHAKDYVRMMWMILQAKKAEDWVIATGKTTTVRDFVKMSFAHIGATLSFIGEGVDEVGVVSASKNPDYKIKIGQEVLAIDPNYYRPTEVDNLVGDATKAKEKLGWVPEKALNELVKDMMDSDLKEIHKIKYLEKGGFDSSNHYE